MGTICCIIAIISIFVLVFFSAIKTNFHIASYFYILLGMSLIGIGYFEYDYISENAPVLVVYIMGGAIALIGVYLLIKYYKIKGTPEEKEFNDRFREMSHKGGVRRIAKGLQSKDK